MAGAATGRSAGMNGFDEVELASRDEIMSLQRERLAWSLRHAYEKSPFYRRRFDEAGVHPSDFRELPDLAKFPFTTKQDLRDNYPFGMFALPRQQLTRLHASSGTTGRPTVVGYTGGDLDRWAGLMARYFPLLAVISKACGTDSSPGSTCVIVSFNCTRPDATRCTVCSAVTAPCG